VSRKSATGIEAPGRFIRLITHCPAGNTYPELLFSPRRRPCAGFRDPGLSPDVLGPNWRKQRALESEPTTRALRGSQPSPPSTPPPRPSLTRNFGSPLRPQSPPLESGAASTNPRTRVLSHQSTPPSRSDSIRRTSSSGSANGSTTPLPNPNQSDRTRSKARDLLRKHYGLGVGPPPPSGKSQDPMDLGEPIDLVLKSVPRLLLFTSADSPALDAKAYYDQLITTSSLATLLKRESELLSGMSRLSYPPPYVFWKLTTSWPHTEIRTLDNDRQSLVYNHHHELIAASDTISAVR